MFQLRPLRDADMPDVLGIQAGCYREIVPESSHSLRAKILASPVTCFAAESAVEVVAYLISVPVLYPHLPALDAPAFDVVAGADTLYLHDLAVSDAARGTGAGHALVRAALAAGKATGYQEACLIAIQDSVPYWERFGFEVIAPPTEAIAVKLASYGARAQLMRARM